ncbi:MAG: HNH endonuclease [Clostridiales bacterium]|nr:HNH endonuclease [Clostridiales bacterium]
MKRGDVIRYVDMTISEGFSIQRGMNSNINGRDYSIILMSVRRNAPYADRFEENGTTIIYEGHDVQSNYIVDGRNPKDIDQPMTTPSGGLTENGRFYQMAKQYVQGLPAKIVKVYEKIKAGIWVYNGYFILTNAWIEQSGDRNVFKFKLEMLDEEIATKEENDTTNLELEHNRLIPTGVKVEVWRRDKGKCVKCGSTINLHYDHIIPFSKGGSSTTAANIQLLCARCNLKKHDKIE